MIRFFPLIFLLIFCGWLNSCQSNQDAVLIRKWQMSMDVESYVKNMPKAQKEIFEKLTEKQRQEALKEIQLEASKNTFEFKADKSFELTLKDEDTQKGSWKLSDKTLTLTKKSKSGKEEVEELLVKELKTNKVILIARDQEITLIPATN